MAAAAKSAANNASAIGRTPELGRLNNASVEKGTATIVSPANGKSRQRESKKAPSAFWHASTAVRVSTKPRTNVGKDRVRLSRGPNSSRNAGSGRPDINALAHSTG